MPFKFLKTNFYGDPNIGLYGFATDKYSLLGIKPRKITILKTKLKVSSIAGTDLVGIFAIGNKNGILLPKIAEDYEIKKLKKFNIEIINSRKTALGNLILCNDNGCLIPKDFSKFKKQIQDALDVEVDIGTIADLELLGSCARASNKGCLCHREATEKELEKIKNLLKVKVDIGTVGYGNPFIKAGIIVNSNGILVSDLTTGPELERIFEVFE